MSDTDTAFRAVVAHLGAFGVRHALIGANAVAVHGAPRATFDTDLLVEDVRCLQDEFWDELRSRGIAVEVRRGDSDDPLAGVVRIGPEDARRVDVVLPRLALVGDILRRAVEGTLRGASIPVATVPDLILLKLYAGGPTDLRDVEELLRVTDADETKASVERELTRLPPDARRLWRRLLSADGG